MNIKLILFLTMMFSSEAFCSSDLAEQIKQTEQKIKTKCEEILSNILQPTGELKTTANLTSHKIILLGGRDITVKQSEMLTDNLYLTPVVIHNKGRTEDRKHVVQLAFRINYQQIDTIVELYVMARSSFENCTLEIPYNDLWTDRRKLNFFQHYLEKLSTHV